jgi:FkbM family methyltransferase
MIHTKATQRRHYIVGFCLIVISSILGAFLATYYCSSSSSSSRHINDSSPLDALFYRLEKEIAQSNDTLLPEVKFQRYIYPSRGNHQGLIYRTTEYREAQEETYSLASFEKHYSQPYCLFLDVGARVGHASIFMAGAGCRVVAFEFQVGCLSHFRAQINLNHLEDHIRVVRQAVSSERNKTLFIRDELGVCRLEDVHHDHDDSRGGRPLMITTLDDFFPADIHVSLLKTRDAKVLHGTLRMIRAHQIDEILLFANADEMELYQEILKADYRVKCEGQPLVVDKTASYEEIERMFKNCTVFHFYLY